VLQEKKCRNFTYTPYYHKLDYQLSIKACSGECMPEQRATDMHGSEVTPHSGSHQWKL